VIFYVCLTPDASTTAWEPSPVVDAKNVLWLLRGELQSFTAAGLDGRQTDRGRLGVMNMLERALSTFVDGKFNDT